MNLRDRKVDAKGLVLIILNVYGYLRIEVTQLLEAISEFNTHHCKVLVQELVDDIIRQKDFPEPLVR